MEKASGPENRRGIGLSSQASRGKATKFQGETSTSTAEGKAASPSKEVVYRKNLRPKWVGQNAAVAKKKGHLASRGGKEFDASWNRKRVDWKTSGGSGDMDNNTLEGWSAVELRGKRRREEGWPASSVE